MKIIIKKNITSSYRANVKASKDIWKISLRRKNTYQEVTLTNSNKKARWNVVHLSIDKFKHLLRKGAIYILTD